MEVWSNMDDLNKIIGVVVLATMIRAGIFLKCINRMQT